MSVVVCDVLRDSRHRSARAARDLADWLAYLELEGKADRTRDDYERTGALLLRTFPEKALSEITDGDLMAVLRTYPEGGRRTRRAHLSSFFAWAYLTRRITSNPIDLVPRQRRIPTRVARVFSEVEVALLENLPSPDGQLFTILFGTGIRKGEARRLRLEHIDLTQNELIVYQGKGSKDRLIPLPERVVTAVADLSLLEGLGRSDHLWYSKPGGGSVVARSLAVGETSFHRWWTRCIEAAEVRPLNPHATRHTYATLWRRRGLHLDELQLLLGHASVQTTSDLYVHTEVSDVAKRMRQLLEVGVPDA